MSNVTLSIGGRQYTVACGPGEEEHIRLLGREIDTRMRAIPGVANQAEPRALLFAALFLADELHEAQKNSSAPQPAGQADTASADALESLAERLEALAAELENAG